jgi:hypothetical protein
MEREYIRDRTLEGQESARTRGKTIGEMRATLGLPSRRRPPLTSSDQAQWAAPARPANGRPRRRGPIAKINPPREPEQR